jgi:hypothetical protein
MLVDWTLVNLLGCKGEPIKLIRNWSYHGLEIKQGYLRLPNFGSKLTAKLFSGSVR